MKTIGRIIGASAISTLPLRPQAAPLAGLAVRRLAARSFVYCAFLVVACGYAIIYILALRTGPTSLVHGLFWLCTLLALGAVQLLIMSGCQDREAALTAVLLGALFYLPKFFRSPRFFDYHDELAHWYATEQLLAGHGAFAANADNPIVQYYPGLHVLTAALSSMTGLSVFAAGNIVCAWAHMVTCLAVYGLCHQLTNSPRTALSAVLIFAANPAFFYFDAQFAYETLGIVFFIVILLWAMRIATPLTRVSWVEIGLTGLLIVTLVVTHHVTSYLLAGALTVLLALSCALCRRAQIPRRSCYQLVALAGLALAASLTWMLAVARGTLTYIRGPVVADLTAVRDYIAAGGHPQASRPLFAGAEIPTYEIYFSYVSIVVLFVLYMCVLAGLRRKEMRNDPRQWTLLLLGAVYFTSLPVVFVFSDQTAKRPWAFAFVGLAVTCAPVVCRMLIGQGRLCRIAGFSLVVILYVGGVVTLSGYDIRFPGTYNAASDALSTTPDVIAAASWLDEHYGYGNSFIADETDANVIGAYGGEDPRTYQSFGYEPWKVIFPTHLGQAVYAELRSDDARFIVIDKRIATGQPVSGNYYFSATEPDAGTGLRPFDLRSLDKFRHGPFSEIYNNGNIVIWEYRNWVRPSSMQGIPRP